MLIGTFRHNLDAKKRMRMPSKFKSELDSNIVVAKGTSKNLFIFSKSEFDELYKKLMAIAIFDEEAQKPIRKFLSSAFEIEEDTQGRHLLPKELCDYAELEKEIVFVGVGNRVEIWSEKNWQNEDGERLDFNILGKLGV